MTNRPDARGLPEIGRRARLELTFERRHDRTALAHSYAEPPFRPGHCFAEGDGLHMIVASSAPGIFGGDSLQQSITVAHGARVRLTSQSALQLHPAADGSIASLVSAYRVERGGSLHCEWDPIIPFGGARIDQRIRIDLEEGATLFWSDAMMSGREARGERWTFEDLAHELKVFRGRSLAYLERYRIVPADGGLDRRWVADAACYFGTLLVADGAADRERAARLHAELCGIRGVHAAVDVLAGDVTLVRLMAASGVPFHDARALVSRWKTEPAAT